MTGWTCPKVRAANTHTSTQGYRIFNTWLGDPIRVVMLKAVAEEIKAKNLLASVSEGGEVLLDGLCYLEVCKV